jgi:hypothetical protein
MPQKILVSFPLLLAMLADFNCDLDTN